MGLFQLKGKQQEIELYSVFLKRNEEATRNRRKGMLFRKKVQNA